LLPSVINSPDYITTVLLTF